MSDIDRDTMDDFVHEGMKRYREASTTLVAFGEEVERRLQRLLYDGPPSGWGAFVPSDNARARSTRYWSKYPLLNAKIDGEIGGTSATITIAVNWYESDGTYPFYALGVEPVENHVDAMQDFEWREGVRPTRDGIRFEPNPEILDMKDGFRVLLEEAVRFLGREEVGK